MKEWFMQEQERGLCAFEARTGKQLWRNEGWGQGEGTTSTLTLGNGLLIGSAQWNALYGNDAQTGEKLWAASDNGLRNRGASPAMHGALLYLISDKSFFILEAATGKVIVRKPLPYNVDVTSTPLLTDKEIIFGSAQKGLIAWTVKHWKKSGLVRWGMLWFIPVPIVVNLPLPLKPVRYGREISFM